MPEGATDFLPYSLGLALSCLVIIPLTEKIIRIFPWLLACLLRAKECNNLEDAFSIARARNSVCIGLTLPMICIASLYRLYPPIEKLAGNAWGSLGLYAALFAAYFLLRRICTIIFRGKKTDRNSYAYCIRVTYSFCTISYLLVCVSAAVCALCGTDACITRAILLWELGICYLMNLLRTTQIFAHYQGYLRAFLYLCTLEILPTAILVIPAVIF